MAATFLIMSSPPRSSREELGVDNPDEFSVADGSQIQFHIPEPKRTAKSTTTSKGRKKTMASSAGAAPKRPPQRGLGVAQLERLRHEEYCRKNVSQAYYYNAASSELHRDHYLQAQSGRCGYYHPRCCWAILELPSNQMVPCLSCNKDRFRGGNVATQDFNLNLNLSRDFSNGNNRGVASLGYEEKNPVVYGTLLKNSDSIKEHDFFPRCGGGTEVAASRYLINVVRSASSAPSPDSLDLSLKLSR